MPKPYLDPEHRTPEQEIEALDVLSTPAVEDVRWVKPYRSHPKAGLIKLGTNIIHLPDFITDDLGEGVTLGYYKPSKIRGGWMGESVEI